MAVWGFSDFRPGKAASAPPVIEVNDRDPSAARETRPKVLMFVHPACPCTRSSLEQLVTVLREHPATADVIFVGQPRDVHEHIAGSLLQSGRIRFISDETGELAHRYSIATSGQCIVYDRDGKLTFSGGITAGKGHIGPSEALVAFCNALDGTCNDQPYAVYGCPLFAQ